MTNGIHKHLGTKMAIPATEDTGFCSSEEYFENEIHSPTDNSEDSVEVKVSPILSKNKRKLVEPRKVEDSFKGPLKKRMCLKVKAETESSLHPFRPWSPDPKISKTDTTLEVVKVKSEVSSSFSAGLKNTFLVPSPPTASYFRPPSPVYDAKQEEPIALVKKSKELPEVVPRVPVHPQIATLSTAETERIIMSSAENFPALASKSKLALDSSSSSSKKIEKREQRNYKNMTRERRIEANARERTRVHTISAAFDTLRRSIPSYSHNQKLSKLSVLRIACSYIMTLSNIVNDGEESSIVSNDNEDSQSVAECVDLVSRTIQREGKLRKKKDDND